ncbi:hypothetical protein Cni_G11606 [Canna indica]|uniref:Anion-transporting ATPase-like domain-containing protein n=1 Tax=Canna indica TaxID=4628 RepID=A0AAQ3K6E1_9LILI|nr:hypothetical protein Cni_G11606 [Canna indica]
MALLVPPRPLSSFSCWIPTISPRNPNAEPLLPPTRRGARPRTRNGASVVAASLDTPQEPARVVTFLGKGGSGKTTAAVLAAQVSPSLLLFNYILDRLSGGVFEHSRMAARNFIPSLLWVATRHCLISREIVE